MKSYAFQMVFEAPQRKLLVFSTLFRVSMSFDTVLLHVPSFGIMQSRVIIGDHMHSQYIKRNSCVNTSDHTNFRAIP